LALILTHAPPEGKDNSLEKVGYVIQLLITTRKQYEGNSMLKLENIPIYIQHVEATALTTKQMIMENEL